jgi:hypothetical protein
MASLENSLSILHAPTFCIHVPANLITYLESRKEAHYTFHHMGELERIKSKNASMKAKLLIYQQKVKKN